MLDFDGVTKRFGPVTPWTGVRSRPGRAGYQQRVQLIAALVDEPDLLVLDEPFSGLDPIAMEAMAALLSGLAGQGATVLFSSHQLDLVQDLCQDVPSTAAQASRDSIMKPATAARRYRRRAKAKPAGMKTLRRLGGRLCALHVSFIKQRFMLAS